MLALALLMGLALSGAALTADTVLEGNGAELVADDRERSACLGG